MNTLIILVVYFVGAGVWLFWELVTADDYISIYSVFAAFGLWLFLYSAFVFFHMMAWVLIHYLSFGYIKPIGCLVWLFDHKQWKEEKAQQEKEKEAFRQLREKHLPKEDVDE